eukprot:gene21092-41057_t
MLALHPPLTPPAHQKAAPQIPSLMRGSLMRGDSPAFALEYASVISRAAFVVYERPSRPSQNGTAPHSYWLEPVASATVNATDAPEVPGSDDFRLIADNMPAL